MPTAATAVPPGGINSARYSPASPHPPHAVARSRQPLATHRLLCQRSRPAPPSPHHLIMPLTWAFALPSQKTFQDFAKSVPNLLEPEPLTSAFVIRACPGPVAARDGVPPRPAAPLDVPTPVPGRAVVLVHDDGHPPHRGACAGSHRPKVAPYRPLVKTDPGQPRRQTAVPNMEVPQWTRPPGSSGSSPGSSV